MNTTVLLSQHNETLIELMVGFYTRAFPTLFTAFRLLVGIPLMKKTHRQDFCQLCLNFYPKIWTWICLFTLSLFANSMHFIDLLICTSVARWRPLKINTSWPTSSLFSEHHNILSVFYFFFKRTILAKYLFYCSPFSNDVPFHHSSSFYFKYFYFITNFSFYPLCLFPFSAFWKCYFYRVPVGLMASCWTARSNALN